MELGIMESDKILVVAPHPDDESIGCGGLLAKYGAQCSVLLMTDGGQGVPTDFDGSEDIREVRKKELQQALREAGVEELFCLNAPDGGLKKRHDGLRKIDLRKYTFIFVTNPWEIHDDHRAAYHLIRKEMRRQGAKAKLIQYEVWTPLREPNYFLDISDQIDTKRRMIAAYVSQLKDKDYMNTTVGLNVYRGILQGQAYAEAYSSCGLKHALWVYYSRLSPELKGKIKKVLHR